MKKLWKKIKALVKAWLEDELDFTRDANGILSDGAEESSTATTQQPEADASSDAVDFALLDWCWGGFRGGGAKRVDGCEIGGLKVAGKLTYKWVKGGCENLGATSKTDAGNTICALFCKIDGVWKGGKFDWISTSRTSRDLKNIVGGGDNSGGYGGWDKQAISKASEYAFVIVSKDEKKRTNVIKAGR